MKALKRLLGLKGDREPVLSVLMVCSGNICRSPTAEVVLRSKLERAGLAQQVRVDSAGTHGFHANEAPDPRAQAQARQRGYDLSRVRSRKVVAEDFQRFQRILAMDEGHLDWLQRHAPADSRARLERLLDYGPDGQVRDVPDPYYGAGQDFARVLDLVEPACDRLVDELRSVVLQPARGELPAKS